MTLLFAVGCQKQATITSADPQIQRIIKMAATSADKSMEKELIFLRDVKKMDLSSVEYYSANNKQNDIFQEKEPAYRTVDKGGWDIVIGSIPRKEIQQEMSEYYASNYLTGTQDNDPTTSITEDRLQVIKELQFMRDEGMITPEYYEKLIKRDDIPFMWGTELWEQMYPTCDEPSCDAVFSRQGVQNMMKDKEKILHPKLDKKIIELSSDPQIQKELLFMKEKMGINLSNVSIGKGQASGDYGIHYGNWDFAILDRESVQQQMKKAD
jgi:hypothetical protein